MLTKGSLRLIFYLSIIYFNYVNIPWQWTPINE
jgi:hypothetical protein